MGRHKAPPRIPHKVLSSFVVVMVGGPTKLSPFTVRFSDMEVLASSGLLISHFRSTVRDKSNSDKM